MVVTQAFGLAYQLDESTVKLMKEKYYSDIEADSGEKHHLLPVPAVYLVDAQGVFGFQHVNADFTVRMDSQELLRIARERVKAAK